NQHVVGEVERLQDSNERKEFEERNKVKITPKVWVFFTREEKYEATIEYISHDYDMAILKIDRKNDRKKPRCLALSNKNPEELPRGTAVMCCGFPAIDRQPTTVREAVNAILAKEVGGRYIEQQLAAKAFDFSLRRGFVNVRAHDYRYMKVDPETNKILEAWPKDALCIQHDAEIFGGNSGGPLLLEDGTVVGINAIKVTGGAEQARLNYAITLPQLRKDIEKIVPGAIWR
ncbi:MAG TPA: trypsin-like peptidase domain-containing protein, partial [Gemmataceae bacterium]|nr:trypsin-like peptidase domain-containing protein [Gemmataceae bacterium]